MQGRQLADGRILLVGNTGLLAVSNDGGQTLRAALGAGRTGFSALAETDGKVILVGRDGHHDARPGLADDKAPAAAQ